MRRVGRTYVAALCSVACALEEALALRRTLSFLQAVCQCRKADKTAEKSPLLPARGGRGRQNVAVFVCARCIKPWWGGALGSRVPGQAYR